MNDQDQVSREELIGATCAECNRPLTDDEIDVAADWFRCDCGSKRVLLMNGESLAPLPDP